MNNVKKSLVTGLVLAVFALICGTLLAVVNYYTAPIIKSNQVTEVDDETIKAVYPSYNTSDYKKTGIESDDKSIVAISSISKDGEVVAFIYIINNAGRDGTADDPALKIAVGVDSALKVTGWKFLVNKDTGAKKAGTFDFGMVGESSTDAFDSIAGSTDTSDCVKEVFDLALQRAKADFLK